MMQALPSLQFGPHFDVAVQSCVGADPRTHLENQDNFLLIDTTGCAHYMYNQRRQSERIASWPEGCARVAVLDGMGGHGRGREAAEAVVAGLINSPPCDSLAELTRHLDLLHVSLQHQFAASEASKRPGTTLTMLELRPGKAPLLYHVGDSRLYEVKDGRVHPMTVDHVPATAFAMAGLLDEREWWQQVHGEHRSQISQAFILGNAFANPNELSDPLYALSPLNLPPYLYHLPDRRAVELDPSAVYVLATDGFWACSDPSDLLDRWPGLLARHADSAGMTAALFEEMLTRPPPNFHIDNLTAIVLRRLDHDQTAVPIEKTTI
jgi:serine/threonine protein phosphatase PrpC